MKHILVSIIGCFLIVLCSSSPTSPAKQSGESRNNTSIISTKDTKNDIKEFSTDQSHRDSITEDEKAVVQKSIAGNAPTDMYTRRNISEDSITKNKDVIIIDLDKINKMSPVEYIGRQIRSLWDYLVQDKTEEKETSFIGRCIGLAKKIRQLIPIILIGGGIIITKLGFLVIFALKSLGLLGLILLLNVGTIAAKLGALVASKKSEHSPHQNLHFHVQPWKSDEHEHEHIYSSSHYGGPPYGLYDRSDIDLENHKLYNLYKKLKLEQNLNRYLSSVNRNDYHLT